MSILTRHHLQCDVLVAGGGPAGVACAIAAARSGVTVILCQDRPVLGGNASSEVRMHVVGADCSGKRGVDLQTEAREGGIIEEIRLENAVRNPQCSASMFDLILYEKCRAESNLKLMLNSAVTGVRTSGRLITQAVVERISTEDWFIIDAAVFIDCTGDGRLGAEAGASFRTGRESREQFDEPGALDKADRKTLGSTLLFQARRHNRPMPFAAPPWARKFTEDDLRLRPHAAIGVDTGLEYGYWWAEWGGCLHTIKDNEIIRDELLAIVLGIWDHIKNGGDHGADNWALEWFGFLPGKRESRRFVGLHTLTENDVLGSRVFEDAIAYGGWPIDTHPPEGVDAKDEPPCVQKPVPYLYDIPLRCCVSRDVDNLMFAGRNISATHLAFASTRVMATCAVIGQGVGTAAAISCQSGVMPARLAGEPELIRRIQQRLLSDDAFLIGIAHHDPDDLAKRAKIRASSEQPAGPVTNLVSGITRAVHGPGGVGGSRRQAGSHRWMSDPAQGLPAWVELNWPEPVSVRRIQLIFDTGMHRVLTLSHSAAYVEKMKWGMPQPETVRDFRIEFLLRSQIVDSVSVVGNYQRRRCYQLSAHVRVDAIRIIVLSTNGIDHARISEVSVK